MMDEIMAGLSGMGTSVLLPITVIFISLALKIRPGKALRSGLMIGASFVGIDLIIEMMNRELGPAAQAMSERFGLNLRVIDIGWQGVSPMIWASGIVVIAVPLAILINVVMLLLKKTRTVNIDFWNIWHMAFTGEIVRIATGKLWCGIAGVAIHAVIVYRLGDYWAPYVRDYFELDGLTVPNGSTAYMAPYSYVVDWIIERIPAVNRISFSMERLQERAGVLAEPVVMGWIIGTLIGLLAGYPLYEAIPFGIEMAAVMVLMPKIVKGIMEGLLPVSEKAKELLAGHFGNGEFYIGLDPSVLLGDSQVITAGLLFLPITLLIALIVPGNRVLPFGDLATISFFIALSVAIHRGNLFRTLVSGCIIMYQTIWTANQTIPWLTELAKLTGSQSGYTEITALDQGGCPITYVVAGLFSGRNMKGVLAVGAGYLFCLWFTGRQLKKKKEM